MSVISDNYFGYKISRYQTLDGVEPFSQWIENLNDGTTYGKILRRINRVQLGNLGDWGSLGGGVYELRMQWGPGFRIYFGFVKPRHIVLLLGGVKHTQRKDIYEAKLFWLDFKRRFQ